MRVYAEAETQVGISRSSVCIIQLNLFACQCVVFPQGLADSLAVQVGRKVFELAGGIGEPPTQGHN